MTSQASDSQLSPLLIHLLKGVLYQDSEPQLWQALLALQARARDYLKTLGLELILDESEGYAFLRTRQAGEEEAQLPKLISKRQLPYGVSLLLALLRRKLAETDASGGSTRLILSREEVVEMVRLFLPEGSNQTRQVDKVEQDLNKIVELGFLRTLKGQTHHYEVRRILKAFVDVQWLSEFDARMAAYQEHRR